MAEALEKAERHARLYAESQQDAWARIQQKHDQAMLVLDIEDLVDHGLFVLRLWLRHAEQWHMWVSQDAERYDAQSHELLNEIEKLAVDATNGTLRLVEKAKNWGYEIERETEFEQLAHDVLGCARQPGEQFRDVAFRKLGADAVNEHERGKTKEIGHWGE